MSTPNFESFATKEFVKDEIHRLELKIEQSKVELTKIIYRFIYTANVIQFLATVSAMIGIFSFIVKK